MQLVDLDLFRCHVRADRLAEEDEYLRFLLQAAQETICTYLGRTEAELMAMGGGRVPTQISEAIMLLGAHWYNTREAVGSATQAEIPYTLSAILKPFEKIV